TGEEGAFLGVYNHSDSYPTWMGKHLWELLHQHYHGDVKRMLADLIDAHPGGWSAIPALGDPGRCYCHKDGKRSNQSDMIFTHKDEASDIEWFWVFNEENNRLFVIDHRHHTDA